MPGLFCYEGANHRPLTGAFRCPFSAFGYVRGQARRGAPANPISYQCSRRYGHDHVAIRSIQLPSSTTSYQAALQPYFMTRERSLPPKLNVLVTHDDPWRRTNPIRADLTYGELRASRLVRGQPEIPAMF
eukprot:GEMP01052290.1.p1 GENE.GEMP01052290.1~~GEMP01052290.1.p1  ORF type:complete len:130 (+),score=11.14 GEMP01052290.1:67-456(+)